MNQLFEQYRPRVWSDVVGQDKALRKIEILRRRGLAGRAYWISGQSGTGKTTIARLIASEVAEDDQFCIAEIDATTCTPTRLQELEYDMFYKGWGKGGKAYIINEAHGLRREAIRQFLVLIERLLDHVVLIFTTTSEGQKLLFEGNEDTSPLLSRCTVLELARRDLARPFAERAKQIAEAEHLDGKPIAAYIGLARKHNNNMRRMLEEIATGEMLD
jgi:DNA polymerase III gamma/tau subunit